MKKEVARVEQGRGGQIRRLRKRAVESKLRGQHHRGDNRSREAEGDGGGGAYSCVFCLSHFTTDHASLSRRKIVPTPY